MIAVEYYGKLNLNSPKLHSDLLFCQQSNIKDVLIYFSHKVYPLTKSMYTEIKQKGMRAIILNILAIRTPAPIFVYSKCNYWAEFFKRYNIKIHISWYKFYDKSFPILEAMNKVGGVSILYQRSYEPNSETLNDTYSDIYFSFSNHCKPKNASYCIVTGFLGDFRFNLLKKESYFIKKTLRNNGCEHIIAYLDENSAEYTLVKDEDTQKSYEFILNKVLNDKRLGLVLKPKFLKTLKKRLGNVYNLIIKAQKINRCFIFDSSYPPSAAALVSDITIHSDLCAGTAGIEAALTGTPTLLLDMYKFKSPLHELGDWVVFQNIESLWWAVEERLKFKKSGIGDWSRYIDKIDPFRDGLAINRMSDYLKWLMEGFKADLPRETILADAAERYRKIWGEDKVFSNEKDKEGK